MEKIKKYLSYILIFLGLIIGIKTIPSGINKILLKLNIKNQLGIDMTSCTTIGFSITANQFCYALFLFAFLCLCIGLLLLFRKQEIKFKYNYLNISFLICFIILSLYLLFGVILYTYLLMLEYNLFANHIIFTIAFIIGCLTNILYLALILLIWFDTKLDNIAKIICLIILSLFFLDICFGMESFIYLYGVISSLSETTPEFYFGAFDYILTKLGIGALCMDNNPCQEYFKIMNQECDRARDAKALPRLHNVGGPASIRWIARIMSAVSTVGKVKTQHDCNDARKNYYDCMDFINSVNNKRK